MKPVLNSLVRCTLLALVATSIACDTSGPTALSDTRLSLGEPEQLAGEFTSVIGVRELRDGSVWVADDRERTLTRTSSDRGQLAVIRAIGEGPREYRDIAGLFPVSRDSTAVWTGRALLLLDRSAIVGDAGSAFRDLPPRGDVRGIDASGGVLLSERQPQEGSPLDASGARAAAVLHRSSRDLSVRDSVAVLERGVVVAEQGPSGDLPVIRIARDSRREAAAYFGDGTIAIVRALPYRVEWLRPDGDIVVTDSLPVPESFERPVVWLDVDDPIAAADGSVIVPLVASPELGDSPRYDVILPQGRRGFFVVPPNQELIGSGASALYLVETNELDLQTVIRVPWTPNR